MAKPKSPLFSFEAHGTVANTLTFQKRAKAPYARTRPIPSNPNTLLQRYRRWDYLHYCYMWGLLTPAQKATWNTNKAKGRMSGFNYWMKINLLTLPDLLLRTYLDTGSGSIAIDSSKGNHNGTITQALWIPGKLGQALLFDGINDRVDFGTSLDLAPKQSFTVEILLYPHAYASRIPAGRQWRQPWCIFLEPTKLRIDITDTLLVQHIYRGNTLPPLNQWSYLMITYDYVNKQVRFKVNTTEQTIATTQYNLVQPVGHYTFLGANPALPTYTPFDGILDHFSLYSYSMSFTEARKRYERMFP